MNITLLEKIRALLKTTNLVKSFWAEAANTACYVINRSPSTAINLKTPMEMWTGKPVDCSHLHVFGSPIHVMYNDQERSKLDPKSRKCIFLGYVDGVKGYRLWDPTVHKVVMSRDVIFVEDKLQETGDDSTTMQDPIGQLRETVDGKVWTRSSMQVDRRSGGMLGSYLGCLLFGNWCRYQRLVVKSLTMTSKTH